MRFETTYGGFSDDGKEYVIKTWDVPRPWINYLTNGRFCSLVSQTGGGYAFLESSGYHRLTRGDPQDMVLADPLGRYIYLYDRESTRWWRLTGPQVGYPVEEWETRHGFGYTRIFHRQQGIEGIVTFFVPVEDDAEVWMVQLTNRGDRPRQLTLFTYVDWCLGDYQADLLEAEFNKLFNVSFVEEGILYATKRLWSIPMRGGARPNLAWDRYAFMAASFEASGFDLLKERFIGRYRSAWNPLAVERGQCTNSSGDGQDLIAALQTEINLEPQETFSCTVLVGSVPVGNHGRAVALRRKYTWEGAEAELSRVRQRWKEYMDRVTVETPDDAFDLSVNYWNKYQAWVTFHWARMDSYYVGGGSIIGFRDSCQDILGVLPNDPPRAVERLKYIARHQFRNGGCLHNWDPVTDLGVVSGHSDDPLWLVLAILFTVKEVGDLSLLDTVVDFYDEGSGSLWEHLNRALEYVMARSSPRGIPLIGAGDWNDALDHVGVEGRGESTMVAEHLCWMLREVADLAERRGEVELAQVYGRIYMKIKEAVNAHLWDGEWYIRATRDDGLPLGSRECKEGRIYLNAQSWAVISGIAEGERALRCMDAVAEHLDTPYGPALFLPAYHEPDPAIGIITRFCPGTKENGAIFNHPVCWAVIAECLLGRGDRAYELWRRTSFVYRGLDPDRYKVEPYVYAEYLHGPDSPSFGMGEFTWTTGTAAWMWRACLDWILGVQPAFEGLRLNPCIPFHWKRFRVRRPFRGAIYEIEVQNPKGLNTGIRKIRVDGKEVLGNLVPDFRDGKVHHVQARLE